MKIKKLLFSLATLCSCTLSYSQLPTENIKDPIVEIIDNKNVINNSTIFTDNITKENFRVAFVFESEVGLIHRDYFVYYSTIFKLSFIDGFVEDEEDMSWEDSNNPMNQPDITVHSIFTKKGIEFTIIEDNMVLDKDTVLWKDINTDLK